MRRLFSRRRHSLTRGIAWETKKSHTINAHASEGEREMYKEFNDRHDDGLKKREISYALRE